MVQVDWQKIRSANLDLLEDDEAEVDKYFTLLDLVSARVSMFKCMSLCQCAFKEILFSQSTLLKSVLYRSNSFVCFVCFAVVFID